MGGDRYIAEMLEFFEICPKIVFGRVFGVSQWESNKNIKKGQIKVWAWFQIGEDPFLTYYQASISTMDLDQHAKTFKISQNEK